MTKKQEQAEKKKARAKQMLDKAIAKHETAMERSSACRQERLKRAEAYLVACGWIAQPIYRGARAWLTDTLFRTKHSQAWFTTSEALKKQERDDKRARMRAQKKAQG